MDSELLLKFIGYFPDYLSALSHTLFWTTFVETAVYELGYEIPIFSAKRCAYIHVNVPMGCNMPITFSVSK